MRKPTLHIFSPFCARLRNSVQFFWSNFGKNSSLIYFDTRKVYFCLCSSLITAAVQRVFSVCPSQSFSPWNNSQVTCIRDQSGEPSDRQTQLSAENTTTFQKTCLWQPQLSWQNKLTDINVMRRTESLNSTDQIQTIKTQEKCKQEITMIVFLF